MSDLIYGLLAVASGLFVAWCWLAARPRAALTRREGDNGR